MKFSIRDVLWLTVVVALAVCWGLDRVKLRRDASRANLQATQAEAALAVARLEARVAVLNDQVAKAVEEQAARANPPPSSTAP
jgi:hypothetical protein